MSERCPELNATGVVLQMNYTDAAIATNALVDDLLCLVWGPTIPSLNRPFFSLYIDLAHLDCAAGPPSADLFFHAEKSFLPPDDGDNSTSSDVSVPRA
nr:hypothetical protein CFP56_42227 [Quercus suber]